MIVPMDTPSKTPEKKEKLVTKNYLLLILANFSVQVTFYVLIVVLSKYSMEELGASSGAAGIAVSIYVIGALISRFFSGRLIGVLGYKKMLVISASINAVLAVGYPLVNHVNIMIALRFFHGLAFGALTLASATALPEIIPPSRRGEGIGYSSLSMTMSAAIGPFFTLLLSRKGQYDVIFAIIIGFAILGFLACVFTSFEKSGKIERKEKSRFSIKQYIDVSALPIACVCATMYLCYASASSFLAVFTQKYGLESAASVFFLFFAAAALISRPAAGVLLDSRGANTVMYPATIIYAISMFIFGLSVNSFMLLTAAFLSGIGLGAIQSSTQTIVAMQTPTERLGPANSLYFICNDLGNGIGPTLVGFLIPFLGYRGMYIVVAFIAVINIVLYTILYGRKAREKKKR